MTTFGKLSKSERAKARRKLILPAITLAKPEDAQLFAVGRVFPADLSDPAVCRFLYGDFAEHVQAPETSPERRYAVRVVAVDAEKGVIVVRGVR